MIMKSVQAKVMVYPQFKHRLVETVALGRTMDCLADSDAHWQFPKIFWFQRHGFYQSGFSIDI